MMNTRALMMASSIALAAGGVAASFAPAEVLAALHAPTTEPLPLLIQLMGALYFGFAIVNWTAKDSFIGGVYSRPLSLGNSLHFIVGTLTLLKFGLSKGFSVPLLVALAAYAAFAAGFGYLVFGLGTACARGTGNLPGPGNASAPDA